MPTHRADRVDLRGCPRAPLRSGVLAAVLALGMVACSAGGSAPVGDRSTSSAPSVGRSSSAPGGGGATTSAAAARVVVSAVGDVIMGSTPVLPPDDGRHLFDGVAGQLHGDVVLANLDQALTDSAASSKCAAGGGDCYAFRTPPSYAQRLREAGITVVNLANNHSHDFGDAGLDDTRAALTAAGLLPTGMPGQVTVQQVGPLRVAVVGFAPYGWAQSLLDLPAAQALVRQAGTEADVVVVTMHAGGEGVDRAHVHPGTELFLDEDRGDVMAFSRAVIDAGADAVLGSGPHVLRGMEWYRGRLIAYSLGNFVGPRVLDTHGALGISGVVALELTGDGTWRSGRLTPTRLVDGLPQSDPGRAALDLVRDLSRTDFGACGVDVSADGALGGPTC